MAGLLEQIKEKETRLAELELEARRLRAELLEVRQHMMGAVGVTPPPVNASTRGNSTAWAEAVLRRALKPLHVNDIISAIEREYHTSVRYATLVGNISRLVKKGKTFTRTGPNVFGLVEWQDHMDIDTESARLRWEAEDNQP